VKDQGIGIPKDQLEHIFEPFFTTKSRGLKKNSGLGLPIVHSLVTACQGEMQVSSSLRRGTTVRVFLPIYRMKRKKG
jgi:two-component system sensor histidine kinase AtoS